MEKPFKFWGIFADRLKVITENFPLSVVLGTYKSVKELSNLSIVSNNFKFVCNKQINQVINIIPKMEVNIWECFVLFV